jgi:hypothetical protein
VGVELQPRRADRTDRGRNDEDGVRVGDVIDCYRPGPLYIILACRGLAACRFGENEKVPFGGHPRHSRAFRILNFDENPTKRRAPPGVSRHQDSPARSSALSQIYPTSSRLRSAMDDGAGEAGGESQVRRIRGVSLSSAPDPYRGTGTALAGVIHPPGRSLTRVFCRCRFTCAVRTPFRSLPVRSPPSLPSRI